MGIHKLRCLLFVVGLASLVSLCARIIYKGFPSLELSPSKEQVKLEAQWTENGRLWAILVAGSAGYEDYRHQADVCHMYHVLKNNGLQDENIIVFMYDDIATHYKNPSPGTIVSNPLGEDVYAGVPKDYTGRYCNKINLYAVLLGRKDRLDGGSGKVVNSSPKDRILFYYSDHGYGGTLSMPTPPWSDIYAAEFTGVLKWMHALRTYKGMVIIVEACFAGSMFMEYLPEDLNIYAITASDFDEYSIAKYCIGNISRPLHKYGTCLGNTFTTMLLEYIETQILNKTTIGQLFDTVKEMTLKDIPENFTSHVVEFGTKAIKRQKLSLYLGCKA